MGGWKGAGLAAIGLAGIALLLSSSGVADWGGAASDGARWAAVARGAVWLKALLLVDAIGLGAVALGLRAVGHRRSGGGLAPLWTPARAAEAREPGSRLGWTLVGLLVAGAVLRVPGLDSDLWMDEVFSLVDLFRAPAGAIVTSFADDNQHVLYSLLAHASRGAFGEHAWSVRLPAMVAGVLSLWATVHLGRRTLGPRVAFAAAALLALSYHHVWFSQNARGYTLLLLGTVLSTDLLLRVLERGRARDAVAYAAVLALAAWAHLTMVFVGAAHAVVVVVLVARQGLRGRTGPAAVAALAGAAWLTLHLYVLVLPQMLDFFLQPAAGSSTAPVEWKKPLWLVTETLRHLGVGLAIGWIGVVGGLGFLGWGAWRTWRRDAVVTSLMVLPGLLGGVAMVALGRNLWPRFFFNEMAFVALVVMMAALDVGDRLAAWLGARGGALARGVALLPAVAICAVSALSLPRAYRLPKQDYTGARDYVLAHVEPGDRVVGIHMAGKVYDLLYAPEWGEAEQAEDVRREMAATASSGGRHTWVLYTLPGYLRDARPELMGLLESGFEPMKTFWGTLGDGQIVVLRSRNVPCGTEGGAGCP
jgi:hypothetical protein